MNMVHSDATLLAPTKRRKFRLFSLQGLLLILFLLLLLGGVLYGGIGFYYANVLLTPVRQPAPYDLEATNVSARALTVPLNQDTRQPGTFGITWASGEAIVGAIISRDANTVTRQLLQTTAPLSSHTRVAWNKRVYENRLRDTLGLKISTVQVPDPLGAMPAWYVPGKLATWVILVHGRSDTLYDGLRFFQPLAQLGLPILDISYRNDKGAPAGQDGLYHLGDSEWQDLEASVKYARAQGAQHLILYGWSMGGSIIEEFQHHSHYTSSVQALILDAPVLDWHATLILQARNRQLPAIIANSAEFFATLRAGINFAALDQLNQAQGQTPILLFHGIDDTTTPITVSDAFNRLHPGLVTYYRVQGAEHVQSWNHDPKLYDEELKAFLAHMLH
ncbi:MAG: hypothetical protein NVS2B12_19560 [Ktedonobacteraceae bacterium]